MTNPLDLQETPDENGPEVGGDTEAWCVSLISITQQA